MPYLKPMQEKYYFGIDLGGTKVEGVVLDAQYGELARYRVPTERERGYAHIVSRVGLVVAELERQTGLAARHVGIGTPGTIDPPTGLLKNANTVVLNGKPLAADLEIELDCSVTLANDANCLAVAEAVLGCVPKHAPRARVVFGVILGTGVGGGIVVDGKVLGGAQGIGGEWGHMFLDHTAGYCYCGRVGCVERLISGPALERYYAGLTGAERGLAAIAERSRAGGDVAAGRTMDRLLHYFAKGIANVINVLDPDVVVLGGGVGNLDELYTESMRERVAAHLFNPRMDTVFLRPELGDSGGVYGAAVL